MQIPISRRGGGSVFKNTLPVFTYEGGTYSVEPDGENWKIKFLTSGTFISEKDILVDVFAVGGGGGGTNGSTVGYEGAGGGGGYTVTAREMPVLAGTPYEIVIGAGGSGSAYSSSATSRTAGNGGDTSGFNVTALGGKGGSVVYNSHCTGGAGGSGGGAWYGAGGTDGSNGKVGSSGNHVLKGGNGQGTTTREFEELDATLYSNGGYGATSNNSLRNNTGNGGNGRVYNTTLNGEAGSSGILIIRNAR